MRRDLPRGTVTFLFTDVEGSTRLLHDLGAERYAQALAEHRRLLRAAVGRHGGVEVDTQGDAFFVAFADAAAAAAAAQEAQDALAAGPIRVRMGLHTGTPHLGEGGYVGEDVHKGARIAAAGHGGQVLLSRETRDLLAAEPTDLGEHRLKDFDAAVTIFQLGSGRFPPLKTVSNTNLPRPASSFVGREREVDDVVSALRNGARLLTLTGPGGTGKTRLALEAAAELVPDFKSGVFWVGLATIADPSLVSETIVQTLGAEEDLAEHIGDRELLLLLDNLEQVVAAAPELAMLVEQCPRLRLLVTSRELLRVRGEVEYPVQPLADPDAVDLFCARARTEPDETVHRLCRALDNLPLALELAAARSTVLAPGQILDRLSKRLDLLRGGRDADPRQQTLRATIAWSHDLLDEDERRLFARLAVFPGGSTLEAAEQVCGADFDLLQSLVEKSLVRRTDERFWMLETIRDYAGERFAESREADDLRRRHALYFLELAERAYPQLRGNPKEWLDRLEREHDNLRAALDRLADSGETQLALTLAGALFRFWYMHGHLAEGRRRLDGLLRADARPTRARARALDGAAVMANYTDDPTIPRVRAEEALAIQRELGDAAGAAYSTYLLGVAATEEHDFARAREPFEESLRLFRDLGDEHYVLLASDALAWTYRALGDEARGRALHEDVLRQARAQSNDAVVALTLDQLAAFARDEGRVDEALAMLQEALRISCGLGRLVAVAENLSRFASTLAQTGSPEPAARLLAACEALVDELGGCAAWVVETNAETASSLRAQLGEADFAEAYRRGEQSTTEEAVELALGLAGTSFAADR